MRYLIAIFGTFFLGFLLFGISHNVNAGKSGNSPMKILVLKKIGSEDDSQRFQNILIDTFFKKYPKFQNLRPEISELYQKHDYKYLWYGKDGINDFAFLLHEKSNIMEEEGIRTPVPYKTEIDSVFQNLKGAKKTEVNTELLLSSLYFFYENKVFRGLDSKKTEQYGWFLPRKNISYVNRLDSILRDPKLFENQSGDVLDQYFKLKECLKKYREIQESGGWKKISFPDDMPILHPGESSKIISKIKERLRVTGDLETHSNGNLYDKALVAGVLKYKKRHAFTPNSLITKRLLKSMNIPVASRIRTIEINMERCRWMSPNLTKADVFIVINVPSFRLTFFRNGQPELSSKVVVGKVMNQTVFFSSDMSQIVFSPYWNIPNSIYQKEIAPAMAVNANYLAQNDMEWYNGRLRQRPGPKNPLGKVKFLFPNSNDIYLHDTPFKSLFSRDQRAFSHGCIRVERPRDLAISVLKGDSLWTNVKIDAAMQAGKQKAYTLKKKIPVYIGYFTAWVDDEGNMNFYNDIYSRDPVLVKLLED